MCFMYSLNIKISIWSILSYNHLNFEKSCKNKFNTFSQLVAVDYYQISHSAIISNAMTLHVTFCLKILITQPICENDHQNIF